MEELCLAVDIGGTKVSVGLVDSGGVLLRQARLPTPPGADDPSLLMGCIEKLIAEVCGTTASAVHGTTALAVCGVGCGGPMAPGGVTVSPLNIPAWREFPLLARLEESVGIPVYIDNDAKALALGEWWCGGARELRNFIAIVVSTGVGGGLVVDGRLLDGETGNAGHIGHMIVEPDGHLCACGARGCLEAEASGTNIRAITGKDPAEASPEVIERTGRMVGRAVASVANLADIRLALVAGSVALGFGAPFFVAAQREIDERARTVFARGVRIIPAALGADGPLVGAAAVGWRGLGAPGPWR